jgi:hypothetical protein
LAHEFLLGHAACVLWFGFLFFATTDEEDKVSKAEGARGKLYQPSVVIVPSSSSGPFNSHAPL